MKKFFWLKYFFSLDINKIKTFLCRARHFFEQPISIIKIFRGYFNEFMSQDIWPIQKSALYTFFYNLFRLETSKNDHSRVMYLPQIPFYSLNCLFIYHHFPDIPFCFLKLPLCFPEVSFCFLYYFLLELFADQLMMPSWKP